MKSDSVFKNILGSNLNIVPCNFSITTGYSTSTTLGDWTRSKSRRFSYLRVCVQMNPINN